MGCVRLSCRRMTGSGRGTACGLRISNSRATQNSVNANIEQLLSLSPKTDAERMMQSRAVQESESIAQSRLLMFEQLGGSISWPFLTVLVFWICVLFLGFGLFARFNTTVTVALLVGALSVAGAIFLILELERALPAASCESPTNPCATR